MLGVFGVVDSRNKTFAGLQLTETTCALSIQSVISAYSRTIKATIAWNGIRVKGWKKEKHTTSPIGALLHRKINKKME